LQLRLPCQFNALPTSGYCQGVGAYQIGQGAYWTVNLDGLRAVQMVVWLRWDVLQNSPWFALPPVPRTIHATV